MKNTKEKTLTWIAYIILKWLFYAVGYFIISSLQNLITKTFDHLETIIITAIIFATIMVPLERFIRRRKNKKGDKSQS
ncbi:MAG: hypothetical protein IKJ67_04655 [Bacteroidales bacterium]|nr:hypothetical protein [Bacteroidales bacterium]